MFTLSIIIKYRNEKYNVNFHEIIIFYENLHKCIDLFFLNTYNMLKYSEIVFEKDVKGTANYVNM